MAWLDLAELDEVFCGRWLWSTRRPALAWLRRSDYLGDAGTPLDQAVRDRVEREAGRRPTGPAGRRPVSSSTRSRTAWSSGIPASPR